MSILKKFWRMLPFSDLSDPSCMIRDDAESWKRARDSEYEWRNIHYSHMTELSSRLRDALAALELSEELNNEN